MATKDISDLEVCKAVIECQHMTQAYSVGVLEMLANRTFQPAKVCRRAVERANKRGLIAIGGDMFTFRIAAKGRALLDESTQDKPLMLPEGERVPFSQAALPKNPPITWSCLKVELKGNRRVVVGRPREKDDGSRMFIFERPTEDGKISQLKFALCADASLAFLALLSGSFDRSAGAEVG